MDKQIHCFNAVVDAIVDYCDRRKLCFVTKDSKTILMIDADRTRPIPADDEVEITDSAWKKSREILQSGKIAKVENPSANDHAIAHVPLIVRDA